MEKNFNDCTLNDLDEMFGLRWTRPHSSSLQQWLDRANSIELSDYENFSCKNLQELLTLNVHYWLEQELSLHFIGPMFSLIGFTEPYRYNLFGQRLLQNTLKTLQGNDILLTGRPDEIIASGYGTMKTPFFAFNEYKKELDSKGDPAGQVLSAMLVGQSLNTIEQPIYGCYVLGRDWYFLTLQAQSYSISRGFDGTTEDVFEICRLLKALKEIVKELTV